jgi:nanoRNase/pAp phosphatase (c-di-AMP/oligoRNAs hydrolase)
LINTWNRASYTPELIDPGKFTTICIDHHPNEPDPFDLDLSDVNAASATQRVYTLFLRDEKETLVIPEIAKLLMYGLLADSGSFRYVNVAKADTLMIAHELVKLGNLDIQLLEDDIEQLSVEEFEVVQTYVRNMKNIELSGIPPLSYSFIPRDYYGKYSEGVLKNAGMRFKHLFIRQIKGHNWGFVVSPYANGEINVSFRSKPGAPNIRDLAVLFGGGGHIRAASGFYDPRPGEENIDSEEVCQRVIEVIKNTKLKMVA